MNPKLTLLYRVIRKTAELPFMARDFMMIMAGKDYFHLPENLGNFFCDHRSYYTDMRGKAFWNGPVKEGLPVLSIPTIKQRILFPSMILQYGIGSLDEYFYSKNAAMQENINNVYTWLINNIKEDGSFDNRFNLLDPKTDYYSQNSGMTQGLAISFLVRLRKHRVIKIDDVLTDSIIDRIYNNLILPVQNGGGVLHTNGRSYICEYCRKDDYIVLNGWIFGILGIIDYVNYKNDNSAKEKLSEHLVSLELDLEKYIICGKNWSYYDNNRRKCSPIYESLHIHLLDALYRLTGRTVFCEFKDRLLIGYTKYNRAYYTIAKIYDKLIDVYAYGTK